MTGVEDCSLLRMSQIESTMASVASSSIAVTQPSAGFISSNMAIEDTCMYTAAIPSDLSGSFPEGSVLQIMSDSGIVTVAVKNPHASNESSVFKDSSFPIESSQSSLNLQNVLTEPNHNNEPQTVDIPVCTEENIDIDLSFLNEAEENSTISDPKCLNDSAVKDLQGIIADVSSQALSLLQNNLSLSDNDLKSNQEQSHATSEPPKDADGSTGDMVMIDVTKPIQLSQNSLIMVNGQKCILQHDLQTGQVIAYPVKEQDKPRRKRGRPRKTSVECVTTGSEQTENISVRDVENLSEEEREKGLLEVVNDDGALVRRSSRRRKKAKVLKDYETGNLHHELGSDVDETEIIDPDPESYTRKKKAKGPGRPRKYPKVVESASDNNTNNGVKRRGRPKKVVPENEPTQAFLVQTADGQTLMMQVPLSSIPPGISLQEMAQEIANKLNLGLNQANDVPSSVIKDTSTNETTKESITNTIEVTETTSEPALQDHSVGSTTNFSSINDKLNCTDESSSIVHSTCQSMLSNMSQIIDDTVCESEVILENDCTKDENIPENHNNLNVLEVPQCSEDNFNITVPSTTASIDSPSMYCNFEHLNDHDFCITKPVTLETLKDNIELDKKSESSKSPRRFPTEIDNSKNKIDFQHILSNEAGTNKDSQSIPIEELLNKNSNSMNSSGILQNGKKLTDLIIKQKSEKRYPLQPAGSKDCSTEFSKQVLDCMNVNSNRDKNSLPSESIETAECSNILNSEYLNNVESTVPDSSNKSQIIKSDELSTDSQTFENVAIDENLTISIEQSVEEVKSATVTTTVIPVPEKVLPMLLPDSCIEGSKKCKLCQMPYNTEEEIIEHFKSKHPKCICIVCNYMNEYPYIIKRHGFRHINQGCVCKICNKRYKDLYILKMHIKMVHLPPDVLYTCEICEKKFTRKAHLKRHLRIHAPTKQFQCPHCDYKGCEKSDITKHMLIHAEPKFKCELCGKTFRHQKNKDLHLKRHSGQRDYKCAACGFYGYTYTDIRKHIERRHSSFCPQCKQVFTDGELFKEHRQAGTCQPPLSEANDEVKVEESCNIAVVNKETNLLEEMPLDILEADQPQVITIGECSEETLSAIQNGQLIMTSVEGILNPQNGHLIVEGLEDNSVITPDNLSVISVEKDTNKMITFVTADGQNVSLPLKNCSLPLECVTTTVESTTSEQFILSQVVEDAS